jgi:hypothetical protein
MSGLFTGCHPVMGRPVGIKPLQRRPSHIRGSLFKPVALAPCEWCNYMLPPRQGLVRFGCVGCKNMFNDVLICRFSVVRFICKNVYRCGRSSLPHFFLLGKYRPIPLLPTLVVATMQKCWSSLPPHLLNKRAFWVWRPEWCHHVYVALAILGQAE